MIAALALVLAQVGPPAPANSRGERLAIAVRWDGRAKSCVPTVRGVDTGDVFTETGKTALVAAVPKGAELHLLGGEDVPYDCMIGIVDTLKHAGFYGKIGFISEPPPPAPRRP